MKSNLTPSLSTDITTSEQEEKQETASQIREKIRMELFWLNSLVNADGEATRARRKKEYNDLCVALYEQEKRELLLLLNNTSEQHPLHEPAQLQLKAMDDQLHKDSNRHEGEEFGDFILDREYCNERGLTYHGLFSNIIKNTRLILTEQDTQKRNQLIQKHYDLAHVVSGKKMLSATLMYFAGSAILVASVFAAITSFGIASPAVIAGITFGVSLLKGLALTGSIAAGCTGGGMALYGLSRFLFQHKQQCAPQEVLDFAKKAASPQI
jgi:hypothetical protein